MTGVIGDDGKTQGLGPPHPSSVTNPTDRCPVRKETASVLLNDDDGQVWDCRLGCIRTFLSFTSFPISFQVAERYHRIEHLKYPPSFNSLYRPQFLQNVCLARCRQSPAVGAYIRCETTTSLGATSRSRPLEAAQSLENHQRHATEHPHPQPCTDPPAPSDLWRLGRALRSYSKYTAVLLWDAGGSMPDTNVIRSTFSINAVCSVLHTEVQMTRVRCGSNSTRYVRSGNAGGRVS